MSTLEIEERFDVAASPDAVFAFLLDPEKLVACMPGAQLGEVVSERLFKGGVRVKVGTVTIGYQGQIELTRVDADEHVIEAQGEGREKGGAGKVKVGLRLDVDPGETGGAAVRVAASVNLAGKIVRFGRGLIDAVSKELFREFATAVSARVAESPKTELKTELDAPSAAPPPPAGAPLRALPLLWRSLRSWLRRLLGVAD